MSRTKRKLLKQKLEESKKVLNEFIQSATDSITIWDSKLNLVEINKTALEHLNISRDKVIGKNMTEMFPGFKETGRYDDYLEIIKTGTPKCFKNIRAPAHLEERYYNITAFKVADGIGVIGNDITERVKMEKELKESEAKFRTAIESLPFDFFAIGKDGRYIMQNSVCRENWGDVIGEFPENVATDERIRRIWKGNNIKAFSGETVEGEVWFDIKGQERFLYNIISPIKQKNQVIGILGVNIDITDLKKTEHKLKESEEKYRNLINNLTEIITIFDLNGIFLYVSPQVRDILEYSPEEVIGRNGFEFIHPEDIKPAREILRYTLLKKKRIYIELRVLNKRGEYVYVSVSGRLFNIDSEDRIYAVVRDITERKVSEQKVIESEEKFRSIFEQAAVGIAQLSTIGEFLNVNQRFCDIVGYTKEELVTKNFQEITHPNDLQEDIEFLKRMLSGELRTLSIEKRYIKKDESIVWVNLYLAILFKQNGEPNYLISVAEDITARKKAEEALIESEGKFRTIAEQTFMGILIVQDDKVSYVNKALLNIFEFDQEEVLNFNKQDLINLIHQDDLQYLREYRQKLRENEFEIKPYYSYRVFTKSGKLRWIDQFSKPIIYEGKPAELVTIMDTTEKKDAEQELIKLNNLKSELLRRTSHELKTPLVSIKGYTDLLLSLHKDKLDDYILETVKQIRNGCIRLENLIGDILRTAQLESGKIELKKTQDDLSFLIKLSVKELRGLAQLRNQEIRLNIDDNLMTYFEQEQIHQVIGNLLSNAIKYTPPYGKIEILSEIKDNYIIIAIRDEGIGFTEEEKQRIFTQFGKIERYGQGWDLDIEGSGLGLYISKKIIELHDGKIWVESEGRKKGSTFYFSLPMIQ
ncbi:MAG: PAS domain S-box protein [Promethearchaeota archaeon]